jgi:hypothetical protein
VLAQVSVQAMHMHFACTAKATTYRSLLDMRQDEMLPSGLVKERACLPQQVVWITIQRVTQSQRDVPSRGGGPYVLECKGYRLFAHLPV